MLRCHFLSGSVPLLGVYSRALTKDENGSPLYFSDSETRMTHHTAQHYTNTARFFFSSPVYVDARLRGNDWKMNRKPISILNAVVSILTSIVISS